MQIKHFIIFICTAFLQADVILNIGFFGGGEFELDALNTNLLIKYAAQQKAAKTGISSIFSSTSNDVHPDILDFFKKNNIISFQSLPINGSVLIAISEIVNDNYEIGIAVFYMNISASKKNYTYKDKDDKDIPMPIMIIEDNLLAFGPQCAMTINDLVTIRAFVGITPSNKSYILTTQQFAPSVVETTPSTDQQTDDQPKTTDNGISITNPIQSAITDNIMITGVITLGIYVSDDVQITGLFGATSAILPNHSDQISTFSENNAIMQDESIVFSNTQRKLFIQIGINFQIKNTQ